MEKLENDKAWAINDGAVVLKPAGTDVLYNRSANGQWRVASFDLHSWEMLLVSAPKSKVEEMRAAQATALRVECDDACRSNLRLAGAEGPEAQHG